MKIYDYKTLLDSEKDSILSRPLSSKNKALKSAVGEILQNVYSNKDAALYEYTRKYDGVALDDLRVSDAEFEAALQSVSEEEVNLIKKVIQRVENYHREIKPKTLIVDTEDGVICQKLYHAIESVGLYVPGGSAPLISTLIMLAVPAKIAGCQNISVCTPCDKTKKIHPLLLVAAQLCGVRCVYKIGGAQAIAAMAYGTESIAKVNKIYGPGNSWVTEAKLQVSQDAKGAAIDLPAGPSEVLVIADQKANARYIASDLLAQLEHGVDSQAILLTNSEKLVDKVQNEVTNLSKILTRQSILTKSIQNLVIVLTESLDEAVRLSNQYAPEHLIINTDNAKALLSQVMAAGAVFIGQYAAEALGDYLTGSNHVLPTSGFAKSYGGLETRDFMVAISVQEVSDIGIKNIGKMASKLALTEGLDAHALAVDIRLKDLEKAVFYEL
ncbi:histidinol dehydrogenase [Fangia hongkongensis]|uniref:histidinol dehydrogenase n=1 Tax=Fangia hongkongensis TaxID=270495 RepID=UPI00037AB52A|nr:histidinol dehydrogenase [Fangia hongkongensis]MBK2126018.1 histidinol dehydrogenase [Fangia hongkongensis]